MRLRFFLTGLALLCVCSARAGTRLGLVYMNPGLTDAVAISKHLERIKAGGFLRVVLPVWGCQPDTKSNEVGGCEIFPIANVVKQAEMAVAVGLEVSLLPIIVTPKWEWRGLFKPENPSRWFQTYFTWIKSIAIEAQKLKTKELVAATEFSTFLYEHTENWKIVLSSLRSYFKGRLVVTTNWDQPDFKFWSEADAFGISAYFPLSNAETTPAMLLKGAIANRETMKGKAKRAGKPLHITEFGFPDFTTAASKPWYFPTGDESVTQDMDLQARCFDAFLKSWEGESTLPLNFNVWAASSPPQSGMVPGYEVLDKPSEQVLKKFISTFP